MIELINGGGDTGMIEELSSYHNLARIASDEKHFPKKIPNEYWKKSIAVPFNQFEETQIVRA